MDSPFASGVGGSARRGYGIIDFQRNTAFAAFMLVVVVALAFYLVKELKHVLVPVVWAIFCALPVQRAVNLFHSCGLAVVTFCLRPFRAAQWTQDRLAIPFRHVIGKNVIILENNSHNRNIVAKVNNPLINCCRCRTYGQAHVARPSKWLGCCRRRIQILEINEHDEPNQDPFYVNKIREEVLYTIGEVEVSEDGQDLRLKLFVAHRHYPAVLDEELAGPEVEVTGCLAVDKTSSISYFFATLIVIILVCVCLTMFGLCVYWGALSLQNNLQAYINGVKDFIAWIDERTKRWIGEHTWEEIQTAIVNYLQEHGATLATTILSSIEDFLTQGLFFVIYLLFWLMEPIHVAESVGGIFKSYLFLKTLVCILFACCIAGLLAALGCQIWPLYFVVTFVLNYIPEVGSFLVCALALPAVLFDGTVFPETQRYYNTLILLGGFLAFKFICANILEVRMYGNAGGEWMRIHPLVLTALMFVFYEILGITGMFLAVPFVAMVKFYLVTSDIPPMLLNPILCFLEGDEMAAHIIYIDRTRKKRKEAEAVKVRQAAVSMSSVSLDQRHQAGESSSKHSLLGGMAAALRERRAPPPPEVAPVHGASHTREPLLPSVEASVEGNEGAPSLNELLSEQPVSVKESFAASDAQAPIHQWGHGD